MNDLIYEAPPRSGENIEDLADAIRQLFGFTNIRFFPVVDFVEKGLPEIIDGLTFEVLDTAQMGNRMGAVDPIQRALMLRQDVYLRAAEKKGRDRFTVAHEAGHALMHIGTLNRLEPSQQIPPYKDPEWQANRFAAALLMPRHLVRQCTSVDEIVRDFGVSREAAVNRAKALKLMI
jgi:Zn-dependent peptidase ImmA (M78 family)